MDLRLVGVLSLVALLSSLATAFLAPVEVEWALLTVAFLGYAVVLAAKAPSKAPLHGLLVGVFHALCLTGARMVFLGTYAHRHPAEAAEALQSHLPLTLLIGLDAPALAGGFGLVLAAMTFVATKFLKRQAT